ncbi:hypothetical protein DNTS_028470 [Danionella cerebrum]|uniref:Uncharacterized protein n=1 Tax=Danionella cerebrum TaxID=2873325 RepID=A0A553R7G0_9TELE|nr:hypothetical protein DNTS_028470 [Danionella translucida]
MNNTEYSWRSWLPSRWGVSKETKAQRLRDQIRLISGSSVLDEVRIDDTQLLTLTRDDLTELFPGIQNFQTRRTIMELIRDANQDKLQHSSEAFAEALKRLMQNGSNDATVREVVAESLMAFRDLDQQLKAAQASLKPYIEVLISLSEGLARKEQRGYEGTSSRLNTSITGPSPSASAKMDFKAPIKMAPPTSSVRVHLLVCGEILQCEKRILLRLNGVTETELHTSDLVLVLYPIVSRAGTDTEQAIRKIPGGKKAVLVSMYHTFNQNYVCPNIHISSDANIVQHVNVLFHETCHDLLLNCQANEDAIYKIQLVLNQFMC